MCYSKYNFRTLAVNIFSIFSLFNNKGAFDTIKFGAGNQDIHSIPKRNIIIAYDFKFICDNLTRLTETSSNSSDHFLFQNSGGEGDVFQQKFLGDHTPVQLNFKIHKTKTNNEKVYRDTKFLSCKELVKKYVCDFNNHLNKKNNQF